LASTGLLVAALSPSAGRAAEPTDAPLAITGARIVTVSGPVIEKGTLVVAGGKIGAVGPAVAVPPGAKVIDATGQTLYPGLIDGLTSMGLVEIQSVAGSVDTREIRDVNAEARAWVAVNPHSEAIAVTRANGVTAALAAPVSGRAPSSAWPAPAATRWWCAPRWRCTSPTPRAGRPST